MWNVDDTFMTYPLSRARSAPTAVQAAFVIWLGALGGGLVEMLLRWSETPLASIGIRLGIYAVLAVVMFQMRAGRNWAR
jgi:hypothetical protein